MFSFCVCVSITTVKTLNNSNTIKTLHFSFYSLRPSFHTTTIIPNPWVLIAANHKFVSLLFFISKIIHKWNLIICNFGGADFFFYSISLIAWRIIQVVVRISSLFFLLTNILWSSELNSPIPVHFSSLIPRMSSLTLAISCLITSSSSFFKILFF